MVTTYVRCAMHHAGMDQCQYWGHDDWMIIHFLTVNKCQSFLGSFRTVSVIKKVFCDSLTFNQMAIMGKFQFFVPFFFLVESRELFQ